MDFENKKEEFKYSNPALEHYECESQMSIFDFIEDPNKKESRPKIPFELCMNPPVDD